MDGGAWKAAVHGVAEGRTRLSDFTFTLRQRPAASPHASSDPPHLCAVAVLFSSTRQARDACPPGRGAYRLTLSKDFTDTPLLSSS